MTEIKHRSPLLPILLAGAIIGLGAWAYMSRDTNGSQPEQKQTKVYVNSSFDFSLNYPANWRTQECNDNATTLVAIGDRENLVVCQSDAPLNAYIMASGVKRPYWEGTLQDQVNQVKNMYDDSVVTQIKVDGMDAVRVQGKMKDFKGEGFPQYVAPGTIMSQVLLVKGDNLYRIHFQDLANTKSTSDFDSIVSSFKLNEQLDSGSTQLNLIEQYVFENISTLSPVKESLGGKFYVTKIDYKDGKGTVEYEDGHNAYTADFTYTVDSAGKISVPSFKVRK